MLFSCRGVTKHYLEEPVIRDVGVELPEGGFISLLGPSGVGKTTLFNILSGVDRPDEGRVFLDDEDITGVSGRVSYMLQKDLLLEFRTVIDNVILPLVIRGEARGKARARAAPFFPAFGLEGCETKYPRELSGGMRQRAALLRTCLNAGQLAGTELRPLGVRQGGGGENPAVAAFGGGGGKKHSPVILLDEPFSALDAITRRTMQEWYQGISRDLGLSTLFITHDAEEAVSLSDRVYIMTGKPGGISRIIDIFPSRPRPRSFAASSDFARFKGLILDTLEGSG
ncbi:MAG: ABC transporter ATP-binding protein [Spirochaetaceae bacterium]|nr:ABC transporter ATP-binding protein [Spirochaetaceae bacterium]